MQFSQNSLTIINYNAIHDFYDRYLQETAERSLVETQEELWGIEKVQVSNIKTHNNKTNQTIAHAAKYLASNSRTLKYYCMTRACLYAYDQRLFQSVLARV